MGYIDKIRHHFNSHRRNCTTKLHHGSLEELHHGSLEKIFFLKKVTFIFHNFTSNVLNSALVNLLECSLLPRPEVQLQQQLWMLGLFEALATGVGDSGWVLASTVSIFVLNRIVAPLFFGKVVSFLPNTIYSFGANRQATTTLAETMQVTESVIVRMSKLSDDMK